MAAKTVADLAKAYKESVELNPSTFLIYGQPKTGKTRLAATIAKVPNIDQVYWIDLEGGIQSVISGKVLSEKEMEKIIYLPVDDNTRPSADMAKKIGLEVSAIPRASEVVLKLLMSKKPQHYDYTQNKIVLQPNDNTTSFCLRGLSKRDCIVIDSGSQLADSMFSLSQIAHPEYNHAMKWWGDFTQTANALMGYIQTSKCVVIMLCHEQLTEADPKKGKEAQTIPTFGSQNYSLKVGKYFGTVLRTYIDIREYATLSNPTTLVSVQGGSRYNVDSSKLKNVTMQDLLGLSA